MENVRFEADLLCAICRYVHIDLQDGQRGGLHDFEHIPPHIPSEKPTQRCQGIMATLVNSGDFVRSNNDAACYDYLYWLLGLNLLDPAGCSGLFGLSIVLSVCVCVCVCVRACVRACVRVCVCEILTRLTNAGGSTSWLPHAA